MVGAVGFELTTLCSQSCKTIQILSVMLHDSSNNFAATMPNVHWVSGSVVRRFATMRLPRKTAVLVTALSALAMAWAAQAEDLPR